VRLLTALVACLLAAGPSAAQGAAGDEVTLVVRVDGFADDQGAAGIAVWNGAAGFPEGIEHALATTYVPIVGGAAQARFGPLPDGTYAVTVYHDRDGDQRFDKNWLGMPREAWGVSNNVRPRLRAPRFDEASLEFQAGERDVTIHVK